MGLLYFLIFFSNLLCFFSQDVSIPARTITPSQSLTDGQTLVSKDGTFELGFFSPTNSKNRYIGIWYKRIPIQTVVWVANRGSPLNDSSGILMIGLKGNLVLLNQNRTIIWSSNSSKTVQNPVVELLESGNLVMKDKKDGNFSEIYLWESFNCPSDTLLPGMKLGWNLKTGLNRYLSAWKNFDDPSNGDLTYEIDRNRYPEAVMRKKSIEYYRSGPWNGLRYSGAPELKPNPVFRFSFINDKDEVYYMYELNDNSVISRLVLNETSDGGALQRLTWVNQSRSWVLHVSVPRDLCDQYRLCGAFSTCDMNDAPVCQCLKGFEPNTTKDWNGMDWSKGCVHKTPLDCSKGEGFVNIKGLKLPDTKHTWVNSSMNLDDCRVECLKNCSCMGFTNSDITNSDIDGGGTGCVIWFGDLLDIRQFSNAGQDLYIRMAASDLEYSTGGLSNMKKRIIMIVTITAATMGMLFLSYFIWKKKRRHKGKKENNEDNDCMDDSRNDELELPLFDLVTISVATNNFSEENKLGEGGFGPVYKGTLPEKEIAVKRLSKKSVQGLDEFKNEVILISKLQHRNLVKLLGCCIQGEEKMLIYEYMPNRSLDSFIFDEVRSKLLDWQKRFDIVVGIARGLLYLHQDSRLRIIHRDLKASNILLDGVMDPKISDFGMARMFGGDQIEANTNRVVGTYGYMSPEYAVDGHFSVKSDVFSFGVLVLEIVSGKKNRGFYHPDHQLNLLGHAWTLWSEDKAMELVDEWMGDLCLRSEVLRCIQVGLLCVQQRIEDRPTMSTVLLMLSSESVVLPQPQQPGFFTERSSTKANPNSSDQESYTSNDITVTLLEGR